MHRETERRDPEKPYEETVQGCIRPEPKREEPRGSTVPFAIADVLDAEGFDLQSCAAVLDGAAVRQAFALRVRGLLRDPWLKTSSRSLRRHDPDQVPRVYPTFGILSALLGSPHRRSGAAIISFRDGANDRSIQGRWEPRQEGQWARPDSNR